MPGRHELAGSENGYDGYVGLAFRPTIGEEAALRQALALAERG